MPNQFTVDLGEVQLNDDQKKKMTAAIHQAVAGQLASMNFKNQVVLFPIEKKPFGPILNGIIARDVAFDKLKAILQ